ncbi:MAG: hypothetical protein Q4G03_07935, partial [Planctomycetia bacterium]|nr:hypothetical protein [Planctomycetia bacterium]
AERFAPFKTDSCYLFNQYQVDEEHNEQSQVGDSEEVSEEVIAQQNQETQGDAEVTREQIPWKSVGERPEREEEQQESNQTAQTLPAAFLRVNAPKIDGLERIALYPIQAERASTWKYTWKVAYQLDVHVRNGRLDNLSILADDAFAIDPLESNSPFVMTERSDAAGMKVLTFEPKSHAASLGDDDAISLLFTGSFRNEPSTVRLPRFKLLSPNERADISGVRSVVALANSRRDNPILWRVNMKRVEDSDAREELRDLNRGSRAMASAGGTVTRATTLETPRPATIAQNLEGLLFSFYERNEDSYATLANQEDALKASLAHYSFFLNEQREIFGAALFIIQPNSRDDCVLVAPNNCTILEAQVNGVRRLVERIIEMDQDGQEDQHPQAQQRWYIDLDDTPYTKRLLVTFQMTDTIAQPKRKIFSGGQRFEFHLDFPTLENAEFTHTIWICAFESFDPNQWQTRWNVELALANAEKTARLERQPLAYSESGAPMARMQVETAGALWSALQSDLSFLTDARADDSARLKTRWAHVCRAYATEMGLASILNRSPELLDERQSRAIVTTVDGVALDSSKLDSYFPSQGWNVNSYADAHKFVDAYHELDSDSSDKNSVSADASPQKIWTLHSSDSALLLFGASDAAVYSVQIEATPNPFNFANSYYAVAAFILMTTAIILQLLNIRSRRRYRVASYSVLVALWSSVFFFTEWKTVGLIGAGLLAVGQPTLSAILRPFTRRTRGGAVVRNVTEPAQDASQEDSDESDLVPASPERNASDSDLSTVASSKSDSTSAQVEAFWD